MVAKKSNEKSNDPSDDKKKEEAKSSSGKEDTPDKGGSVNADADKKAAAEKADNEKAEADKKAAAEKADKEKEEAAKKAADEAAKAAEAKAAEAKAAGEKSGATAAAEEESESEREPLIAPTDVDTSRDPKSKAPAPLRAPPGDARSMRRADEFCLIYRHKQYLVRREGSVGTLGTWSVTEYPSMKAAAHAYAQECSELTGAGFSDLRG